MPPTHPIWIQTDLWEAVAVWFNSLARRCSLSQNPTFLWIRNRSSFPITCRVWLAVCLTFSITVAISTNSYIILRTPLTVLIHTILNNWASIGLYMAFIVKFKVSKRITARRRTSSLLRTSNEISPLGCLRVLNKFTVLTATFTSKCRSRMR